MDAPTPATEMIMSTDKIARQAVRQAMAEAFTKTGNALAQQRPTITAGAVLRADLRAVRAYLEAAM